MSDILLSAKGVTKVFARKAKDVRVLNNANLEIASNDRIAIVGKSGAGKSTLLHILGTLEEPTEGKVYFKGKDIFAYKEVELSQFRNKEIGFVFQFHYLMLEFTALENVMMPALLAGESQSQAKKRARDFLDRVGLSEREDHKPGQLSGGEQQRVAIARSLMMRPKILLTDEMTGNLDPVTGAQIFDLIRSLHLEMGLALVSVTHDELLAATFDKIYKLEAGELKSVNLH